MRIHLRTSLVFALVVAGCGGSETSEEATTGGEATAPGGSAIAMLGITPPDPPWEEMSEFERELYMVGKILPIMGEIFARHDGDRYGSFECETCHGQDMREVGFRMPSERMYRLPREGTPAHEAMLRDFGPTVEFMQDEVTPAMATLMGQEDLSCASCHPTDG